MITPQTFPVLRGQNIKVDDGGLVCLNDIHRAARYSKTRAPAHWQRLPHVTDMIVKLFDRIVGKSHNSKEAMRSVIRAERGAAGGTYADVRLALAYAEYLSPDLAIEVREVFLRYKAADPTLADEVLERASPEANEWAGKRALGRSVRSQYTKTLQDHGAQGKDYGMCTNVVYAALFDQNATQLKKTKGVAKKGSLRDTMTSSELVFVMASETLSAERIVEERSDGGEACRLASGKSARFIRQAIDADRSDRRGRQGQLGYR